MVRLQTLANFAEIFGTLLVISGVFFGLMVNPRVVPFRTGQLLMGGANCASWRVFRPHTEWLREIPGRCEAKTFR
jgi:hypothetical protein